MGYGVLKLFARFRSRTAAFTHDLLVIPAAWLGAYWLRFNLGVIPGYAGTQRLPRIVGRGIAADLILTGRPIDAQEALRIGLVSQVVSPEELMEAARKTASLIVQKGPVAVKAAMDAIDHGAAAGFEDGCRLEASLFGVVCGTEDMKEGTSAFLEKRKPSFSGR